MDAIVKKTLSVTAWDAMDITERKEDMGEDMILRICIKASVEVKHIHP